LFLGYARGRSSFVCVGFFLDPFCVFNIMELELSRVDYTLVGITAPQTMKLLPSIGTGMMQKVTVKFMLLEYLNGL
jgi:hypothetical protein